MILEKSSRSTRKNIIVLFYITLLAYLSHMQGVRDFLHHFSSEMELHTGEWAAFLHPHSHCKCKNAFAGVDAWWVTLPNASVRILDNASLFIEYMNTDLTISASLQILTVFLELNFCLFAGYNVGTRRRRLMLTGNSNMFVPWECAHRKGSCSLIPVIDDVVWLVLVGPKTILPGLVTEWFIKQN